MKPIRQIALEDGRELVLRHAEPSDLDAVEALYRRLSIDDVQKRFFSGTPPARATVAKWVSVAERLGGSCLVVEQTDSHGDTIIVAEAGFAPLADGDAELGITVDQNHRGWMGPWLLDALLAEAAERGFPNLQALVAARNSRMRMMVCRRGASALPDDDWTNIRLQISSSGDVPSWHRTDPSRRRLLVEGPAYQWSGTAAANRLDYDVTVCTGPNGRVKGCPLIDGEPCPLVDGADGVLIVFPVEESIDLTNAHAARGGRPVVVKKQGEPSVETLTRLTDKIDESESYYAADARSWWIPLR